MPSRTCSRRWVAVALVTTLGATLAGCGFYDVETRASASASEQLPATVANAVTCVTQLAPELLADPSTPSLAEQLSDCSNTTILNQDIIQAASPDGLYFHHGTVAVTGAARGDELELTFFTQASGSAEAGVSNARVTMGTCWMIVLDDGPKQPKDVSGAPCDEDLVALIYDTELVPFGELNLAQR